MTIAPPVAHDLSTAGLRFVADAPLHKRVWWKVGGPADALVTVTTLDQLRSAVQIAAAHDLPTFVLGNGSNLLIDDAGLRGLVLVLAGELAGAQIDEDGLLVLGAGLKNVVLLKRAATHAWSGLHRLGGIPGTVGGAVRMNAGTHLGEIGDLLVDVDVLTPDGAHQRLAATDLALGYRSTTLPPGAVIAQARLQLEHDLPYATSARLLAEHLDRRKRTQPIDQRTCGSTFRNPPGDHAGRLIEAAGLKGHTLGGAQVSPKHANFLVNTGSATAADLRALIEHVEATVLEQFGVALHREVHLVGGP